jgi:general transcription factor IIIA
LAHGILALTAGSKSIHSCIFARPFQRTSEAWKMLICSDRYRGSNGFKSKDHLRQHIRNYHHIDAEAHDSLADDSARHSRPFEGCDKTGVNRFETEKLMKIHFKKEHPSPYQCSFPGCDRVDTKGWMRERDMVKHTKKVHEI